MKKRLLLLTAVLIISGNVNLTIAQVYKAILSGVQETPPVLSKGSGVITATLNNNTLVVTGGFEGLSSPYTVSHIHAAITGQAGAPIIELIPSLPNDTAGGYSSVSNTYTLNSNQIALLAQRKLYINVHSEKHPNGELRGQLLPESDDVFFTDLFGISENPPVLTASSGAISAEVKNNQLIVTGSFSNLSAPYTASHIHLALPGTNGDVIFPLVATLASGNLSGSYEAVENTFTLSTALLDSLKENRFYVNVHSTQHPTGEIRGQLTNVPIAVFHAVLSGGSENPSVNTASTGHYLVSVYSSEIEITGSFHNLSSAYTASHIHEAIFGTNGPVRVAINPVLSTDKLSGKSTSQNTTLTSAQSDLLYARKMYINIHTSNYPNGEIRGQLLPPANYYFTGKLHGYNESTPVPVAENGGTVVEWLGDSIWLSGSFHNLISKYNGNSHIHQAATGVAGSVIIPLIAIPAPDALGGIFEAASNRYAVNVSQKAALANKELYVNVHTEANPGGEVRGQLLPEINYFPGTSEIESPANDASVTIGGNPAAPFDVAFTDASDIDGDKVVYIWQLSETRNFSDILLTVNTGTTSGFSTTIGTVDALLETAGVPQGSTVTLYHRVITTDGSLLNYSDTLAVNLTRSTITAVNNPTSDKEFRIYPNPVSDVISVESTSNATCKAQVVNLAGKVILEKPLTTGINTINVSEVEAGVYFMNILSDSQVIKAERLLVK
jgi:hypothetical protein